MELVESAETMALEGGHRNGRPPLLGITPVDERRIYYYLIRPMTFLSIHPDYLIHRLTPAGPGPTRVDCQWLFEPSTIASPGFDPSDAIAFWDLTNRQDWHVCELQQRGTRSRAGRPAAIRTRNRASTPSISWLSTATRTTGSIPSGRCGSGTTSPPQGRRRRVRRRHRGGPVAAVGAGDRDALGRPDEGEQQDRGRP